MLVRGFDSANSAPRQHPPHPTNSGDHNCLDDCGGCRVPLRSLAGARSPALLAFGGDSAIELFSAVVVLWRFRASAAHGDAERRAARVVGALLFALAAYVAVTSVTSLLGYSQPKPTLLGVAILVAAAIVMPWLSKEKRRLSGATGSAVLRADAAQSALCAYLSLLALAGLVVNAIWHLKWADPIAALAVLPLIVWEGREAMRGNACGCC
jgi:divalent metal cation (Fe/Co/Zn/Cd) transporter